VLPLATDKYFDSSYRLSGLRSQGASAGRSPDQPRGRAWGDGREPFRYAGAGAPVRWLHRVG